MPEHPQPLGPKILTLAYGVFYLSIMLTSEYSSLYAVDQMTTIELYTIPIATAIFLFGVVMMFYQELLAGVILLCWHFVIWFMVLAFWDVGGINIILAFPILILAIWLIYNWYFYNHPQLFKKSSKFKIILRLLLINYSSVYFLIIFFHTVPHLIGWNLITHIDENTYWNYSSFLGIALILNTLLFIVGFAMSWKSELLSGIIFIVWYAIILYLSFGFEELLYSGPWFILSLPILLHGVLYIVYHFKYNSTAQNIS